MLTSWKQRRKLGIIIPVVVTEEVISEATLPDCHSLLAKYTIPFEVEVHLTCEEGLLYLLIDLSLFGAQSRADEVLSL
jgi:hypothetical protein